MTNKDMLCQWVKRSEKLIIRKRKRTIKTRDEAINYIV